MGKKKKNKIRQLDSSFQPPSKEDTLEEEDLDVFKDHLDKTDWEKVAKEVERKGFEESPKKTSKNKELKKILDLHGHTLKEAQGALDSLISEALASKKTSKITLKIITGKGLHSSGERGVLAREIPRYLETKWANRILFIEESPANLMINELPLRGDFTVILNVTEIK